MIRIPLNDDKREKANRLLSRQAQHEAQMSQIRNAATPLRKRKSLTGQQLHTPNQDEDSEMLDVGGTAVTPMKRVPILANFEEWMKMATDNKINATNSWNFALIDYFHDMSLLKEGDGVNFQRASCTLDGCVKIYTNRVDSVATETGKLLSGLADSGGKKKKGSEEGPGGDEEGEDEEGEDGEEGPKKRKKRSQRTAEATLVSDFEKIQLKKMELEFSVDPLFKKASADFDEGGAKGLLLNHLSIDGRGRIVFDSSDDAQDTTEPPQQQPEEEAVTGAEMGDDDAMDIDQPEEIDLDISALARKYFPDLARLDELDVCPSLKNHALGDANNSSELPFIQAPEDWKQQRRENSPDKKEKTEDSPLFDNDDEDGGLAGFAMDDSIGFGEGGEAWAKEAALEPQLRVHNITMLNSGEAEDFEGQGELGGFDPEKKGYGVTLQHSRDNEQENILDYFDKALQKNWAGPEHWKIRRVKDAAKASSAGPTKRKEKEPFEIDFLAPMSQALAEALYTPASSASVISLPKSQWRSKTRNLLPDDKHFNSRQLLRLFLKPKAVLGSRQSRTAGTTANATLPTGDVDEAYWARSEQQRQMDTEEPPQGNYDANFFEDDGMGLGAGADDDEDGDFADARDHFSPPPGGLGDGIEPLPSSQPEGAFGMQLVTQSRRLRPEYVQYARVATKVDVRRLKEEIWRKLAFEEVSFPPDVLTKAIRESPD